MVFIACLLIALMVVSPMVFNIMKRERESELIFRGQQYAYAIIQYQRRTGRFPTRLDDLMKTNPRSIRQLWKDPMCNCMRWGLIHAGQLWPPPPGASSLGNGAPSTYPQVPTTYTLPPQPGQFGQPPATYTQPPADQNNPGTEEGSPGLPIIGVHSLLHQKGLRTFKGQEYYDYWGFIAGQNNTDIPGLDKLIGPANGGGPGMGQRPGPIHPINPPQMPASPNN